jgi:dihydroflavonol-4-reductase
LGKLPSIPLDGVKMSKQSMYYDSSKAVQELGLPQSPIRQALADAIDWFQTNGDITY